MAGAPGEVDSFGAAAMIALERGGVLSALREAGPCRVWEVAGGELVRRLERELDGSPLAGSTGSPAELARASGDDDPRPLVALLCGPGWWELDRASATACVERACALGCGYLYLSVPDGDDAPATGPPTPGARPPGELRRWYWLHEVRAVDPRTPRLREVRGAGRNRAAPTSPSRYRHWIGWRRAMPG